MPKVAEKTLTREQEIERYVVLDALSSFVGNLIDPAGGDDGVFDLIVSEPTLKKLSEGANEIGAPEFGRLMPADEDEKDYEYTDTSEYKLIDARSAALTAQLFAALAAARPGWYAERAAYFADLTAKQIADAASKEVKGDA